MVGSWVCARVGWVIVVYESEGADHTSCNDMCFVYYSKTIFYSIQFIDGWWGLTSYHRTIDISWLKMYNRVLLLVWTQSVLSLSIHKFVRQKTHYRYCWAWRKIVDNFPRKTSLKICQTQTKMLIILKIERTLIESGGLCTCFGHFGSFSFHWFIYTATIGELLLLSTHLIIFFVWCERRFCLTSPEGN